MSVPAIVAPSGPAAPTLLAPPPAARPPPPAALPPDPQPEPEPQPEPQPETKQPCDECGATHGHVVACDDLNPSDLRVKHFCPPCLVGRRIRVYWSVTKRWHVAAVTAYLPQQGAHEVAYADGDREWLRVFQGLPVDSINRRQAVPDHINVPPLEFSSAGLPLRPRTKRQCVDRVGGSEAGTPGCEVYGHPMEAAVMTNASGQQRPWSADDDRQLVELVGRGLRNDWEAIGRETGRTRAEVLERWIKLRPVVMPRTGWDEAADALLLEIGGANWRQVSKYFPSRSFKQCRDRYAKIQDAPPPGWAPAEDEAVRVLAGEAAGGGGGDWVELAAALVGRSTLDVERRAAQLPPLLSRGDGGDAADDALRRRFAGAAAVCLACGERAPAAEHQCSSGAAPPPPPPPGLPRGRSLRADALVLGARDLDAERAHWATHRPATGPAVCSLCGLFAPSTLTGQEHCEGCGRCGACMVVGCCSSPVLAGVGSVVGGSGVVAGGSGVGAAGVAAGVMAPAKDEL